MPNTDIHPELRSVARVVPRKLIHRRSLPVLRRLTGLQRVDNAGVEVLTLPSGVGVRLYRPAGTTGATPALLWIHGGGYVLGTAAQDDLLCRRFVTTLGITVASVDYRLAPDYPYPAPLEDCYTALRWLSGLPGVDADRIAIGGASAGGGLAAALALLARDRTEVTPVFQVLVYPMLDDRSVDRHLDDPGHRLWNATSNRFGWNSYLGGADPQAAVPGGAPISPDCPRPGSASARWTCSTTKTSTTPTRLQAAGVPCEVHVVPGAFHGFDGVAPKADISKKFFDSQCAGLRQYLTRA